MNKDYDHIRKYIIAEHLDEDIRILISDFAILWNRYEAGLSPTKEEVNNKILIEDKVISNFKNIIIDLKEIEDLYKELNQYFKERGIEKKPATIANHYSIQKKYYNKQTEEYEETDIYNKLRRVIYSKDIYDELMFMLIIIKRVRNNMFHGTKHILELNQYKNLFIWANKLLCVILFYNNIPVGWSELG